MALTSEMIKELPHRPQLVKGRGERQEASFRSLLLQPIARRQQFRGKPAVLGQQPAEDGHLLLLPFHPLHLPEGAVDAEVPLLLWREQHSPFSVRVSFVGLPFPAWRQTWVGLPHGVSLYLDFFRRALLHFFFGENNRKKLVVSTFLQRELIELIFLS